MGAEERGEEKEGEKGRLVKVWRERGKQNGRMGKEQKREKEKQKKRETKRK